VAAVAPGHAFQFLSHSDLLFVRRREREAMLDFLFDKNILPKLISKYRRVLAASIPSSRPTAAGERQRSAHSRPAAWRRLERTISSDMPRMRRRIRNATCRLRALNRVPLVVWKSGWSGRKNCRGTPRKSVV
jgi:hypothetical protein